MDRLAELLDAARKLSPNERRQLARGLGELEHDEETPPMPDVQGFDALLALTATVHSDSTDMSTNKYFHVAAAAGCRSS